jgi:hypothetical protein
MVRLDMFSPVGATISGPTNLLFVATGALPPPESVTLLQRGAQWRYLDDGSNQGTAWREPAFLDGTWASGAAQLGFGDEDEATPIRRTNTANGTTNITFYFRSTFVITNLSTYTNLSMWLLRDDGAVVYLNGREVFRSVNMPGGTIFYTTFATSTGENSIDTATLSITNLVEGSNVAAVEMHQRDLTSSDISFDFELIANPTPPVATVQELRAGLFDGLLFLGWGDSSYVLEEAGTLTGPWTQVNDPSPVSRTVTDGQRFFRLRR